MARGYSPFKGTEVITDALPPACLGVISFETQAGVLEAFAGTATKLYRLNGTAWTNMVGDTNYTATQWRFALYGNRLVATNGVDLPLKLDIGVDSTFSNLTNAPKHRFPLVIRDFLIAADVTDGGIFQVKWAARNDSEKWSADCGGGAQQFPDGGQTVGGTGGEFGVILQRQALTRMNFVGGDLRFTFDKIEGAIGCIAPDSIVEFKGTTFYLSENGFQAFNGASSENISYQSVSDTFFSEVTRASIGTVRGALDVLNSCIVWSYPITGGSKLIIYNFRLGRWSEAEVAVTNLHTSFTSSGPVLAGFDTSHRLVRFTGSILTATVSTGDMQLTPGARTMITAARGLIDSAHTVTVGKKIKAADNEATTTASSNTNGRATLRSNGRYHRFQVVPTAAWTELTGIEVEGVPGGRNN